MRVKSEFYCLVLFIKLSQVNSENLIWRVLAVHVNSVFVVAGDSSHIYKPRSRKQEELNLFFTTKKPENYQAFLF